MLNDFYKRLQPLVGVVNMKTIRLVRATHPAIRLLEGRIKESYWKYLDHRGCPTFMKAEILDEPCIAELKSLYASEAKKHGLDWIPKLRHKHGLNNCPFCGSIMSVQVEHFFPKEHFPEFYVLSWNLVPTCSLCNGKRNSYHNNPGEQTPLFHPYFEDLLHTHELLGIDRQEKYGEMVITHCIRSTKMTAELQHRVRNHYQNSIHEEQFNTVLSAEWRRSAEEFRAFQSLGITLTEFVATKLRGAVSGIGVNGWVTALYRSLSESSNLQKQFLADVDQSISAPYRPTRLTFEHPAWVGTK